MEAKSRIPNYVPIAVEEPVRAQWRIGHGRLDADRWTGTLGLRIELLAPTFVASGAYSLHRGSPIKVPVFSAGRPVVPGSSLKGVCRQAVEVLAEGDGPFDPREREKRPPKGPPFSLDRNLFGHLGYQGRVSFEDAIAEEPLDELERVLVTLPYSPQKRLGRRFYGRLKGQEPPGDRMPLAAIPAGTYLRSRLHFRNVSEGELGLVLLALGLGKRFSPRLGGAKYDRCGWSRFEALEFSLRIGHLAEASTEGAVEGLIARAEGLLGAAGRKALATLKDTLQAEEPLASERIRLELLAPGQLESQLPLERRVALLDKIPSLLRRIADERVPRLSGLGRDGHISSSAFGRLVAFHREHRSLPLLKDFLAQLSLLDLYEQPNRDNPLATFAVLQNLMQGWLAEETSLDAQEVLFVWSWAQRQLPTAKQYAEAAGRESGPPQKNFKNDQGKASFAKGAPSPTSSFKPPERLPAAPFKGTSLADQLRRHGLGTPEKDAGKDKK